MQTEADGLPRDWAMSLRQTGRGSRHVVAAWTAPPGTDPADLEYVLLCSLVTCLYEALTQLRLMCRYRVSVADMKFGTSDAFIVPGDEHQLEMHNLGDAQLVPNGTYNGTVEYVWAHAPRVNSV